jgi:hypothetical protein
MLHLFPCNRNIEALSQLVFLLALLFVYVDGQSRRNGLPFLARVRQGLELDEKLRAEAGTTLLVTVKFSRIFSKKRCANKRRIDIHTITTVRISLQSGEAGVVAAQKRMGKS